jgi:hypothetical protein
MFDETPSGPAQDAANPPKKTASTQCGKLRRILCEIAGGLIGFVVSIPAVLLIVYGLFFYGSHFSYIFASDIPSIIATIADGIVTASFVAAGVYLAGKRSGGQGKIRTILIGASIGMLCVLLLRFHSCYLAEKYYTIHDHYQWGTDEHRHYFSLYNFYDSIRIVALMLLPLLSLVGAIVGCELSQTMKCPKNK